MLYDVFISHASEDKDIFVRPLAEALREKRIEVWYDEFSLKVGDSLRRSIDKGLLKSRYGIIVLSKNFFHKNWTEWELDGLVQRFNSNKEIDILPIWHNITHDDILSYSPSLADKYSISSSMGLERVVQKLLEVIRPEGSTLLIARDILLDYGYEPPVISDDWWLDVTESSASNSEEGTFQSASGWGRWGFPLPEMSKKPLDRGNRLAWAAMQMLWKENADIQRITQITHPNKVHEFINSNPGLKEACYKYLPYLLAYAPQLSIRGFGGDFEDEIEEIYYFSCNQQEKKREAKELGGSGLTNDKLPPACDEMFALRHPQFGYYKPSFITCWVVQGDLMGPQVKFYETIDYIAWFFSEESKWIPEGIHEYLLKGFTEWAVWMWDRFSNYDENPVFINNKYYGALFNALHKAKSFAEFKLNKRAFFDLQSRLEFSSSYLGLKESGSELASKFIEKGFIESWFKENKNRKR